MEKSCLTCIHARVVAEDPSVGIFWPYVEECMAIGGDDGDATQCELYEEVKSWRYVKH